MRHCWLMRMLYWPLRSPFRRSSLFEGGTRKSVRFCALFSILSFLRATRWIARDNLREISPCQILSVSRDRKDLITLKL